MAKLWLSVLGPLLSLAILVTGGGFFTSFVSVALYKKDVSETVIGNIHACYFAGLIAGCLVLEKLIIRVGHIQSFAIFAFTTAVTILAQGIYFDSFFWGALRFIAGGCLAGVYIVIESWLLDRSSMVTRGRVLAIYLIAYYGAQAFGQIFFDWIDVDSNGPYFTASLIAALSVIPVFITREKNPMKEDLTDEQSLFALYQKSPLGMIGSFFSGIILGSIFAFIPNVALELDLRISLFMGLTILGGTLWQWPIGKLSDKMDRQKLLIALSFLVLLPTIGLKLLEGISLVPYLLAFILGGITFTIYPLSVALVCDRVKQKGMTHIAGVLLLAYSIGATIGPLAASWIMAFLGASGLYYFIGVNALFLGLFGIKTLPKSFSGQKNKEEPSILEENL